MNSLRKHLIDACIIVTVTLVALVALEYAARLASAAHGMLAQQENPVLARQPWGRQYQDDQSRLAYGYTDYVGFRELKLSSPTINVDEDRRRIVPGSCARDGRTTIWAFGGSTMFGYGTPDDGTIPAHLARILNAKGRCTQVINFGSGYWQSSQGVVQLTRALAQGSRPDIVVFYDGINDTSVVLDGSKPGDIDTMADPFLENAFAYRPAILRQISLESVLVRILRNRIWNPIAGVAPLDRKTKLAGAAPAACAAAGAAAAAAALQYPPPAVMPPAAPTMATSTSAMPLAAPPLAPGTSAMPPTAPTMTTSTRAMPPAAPPLAPGTSAMPPASMGNRLPT